MPNDQYVGRIAARLRTGEVFDGGFDQLLPLHARAHSLWHWSPVYVAQRAAVRFAEHGARRVLDVGAGPGKFCIVAGASQPGLEFHGVEQHVELVATAKRLAELLDLRNVRFSSGDALLALTGPFDGFYFFNPFFDDPFGAEEHAGLRSEPPIPRIAAAAIRVTDSLRSARDRTVVVTYHGLGGPIPSSYDLVCEEPVGSGCLRTWVKTRANEESWYYLDEADDVTRVPRWYVEGLRGQAAQ
jgi:predicted RNA methylase